jgi:hypothetical protein
MLSFWSVQTKTMPCNPVQSKLILDHNTSYMQAAEVNSVMKAALKATDEQK